MKNNINPVVMVIGIVVALAIVAVIGYNVFGHPSYGDGAAMAKKYTPNGPPSGQNMANSSTPPPGVSSPRGPGGYGSSGHMSGSSGAPTGMGR